MHKRGRETHKGGHSQFGILNLIFVPPVRLKSHTFPTKKLHFAAISAAE